MVVTNTYILCQWGRSHKLYKRPVEPNLNASIYSKQGPKSTTQSCWRWHARDVPRRQFSRIEAVCTFANMSGELQERGSPNSILKPLLNWTRSDLKVFLVAQAAHVKGLIDRLNPCNNARTCDTRDYSARPMSCAVEIHIIPWDLCPSALGT